jgi:hypothetical protein
MELLDYRQSIIKNQAAYRGEGNLGWQLIAGI